MAQKTFENCVVAKSKNKFLVLDYCQAVINRSRIKIHDHKIQLMV